VGGAARSSGGCSSSVTKMCSRQHCRESELIVRGRVGVGDDGEAYGGIGEAREGWRRACDSKEQTAVRGEG
jgi:hypothetical protein